MAKLKLAQFVDIHGRRHFVNPKYVTHIYDCPEKHAETIMYVVSHRGYGTKAIELNMPIGQVKETLLK